MKTEMTPETLSLFVSLVKDAPNWDGHPMWMGSKKQCGNLCDLKKRGLLKTFKDEGCEWISFTEAGVAYAKSLGFELKVD